MANKMTLSKMQKSRLHNGADYFEGGSVSGTKVSVTVTGSAWGLRTLDKNNRETVTHGLGISSLMKRLARFESLA